MNFVRKGLLLICVFVSGLGVLRAQSFGPPYTVLNALGTPEPYTAFYGTLGGAESTAQAWLLSNTASVKSCPSVSWQATPNNPLSPSSPWPGVQGVTPQGPYRGAVVAEQAFCQGTNVAGVLIYGTEYTFQPVKNLGSGCSCDAGEGGGSPLLVGDPINVATGDKYEEEQDYSGGPWLTFRRFYNSDMSVSDTEIGHQWRHSFDRSLAISGTPATSITVSRPDGKQETYTKSNSSWATDSDVPDQLTETDNAQGIATSYTLFVAQHREYEIYDVTGVLKAVTDETGQGITLTYSTTSTPTTVAPKAGLLLTVTDPKKRILSFTYTANGQVYQLTQPDGRVLTYAYDTNGDLISVTYPDGKSRQYVYNESSLGGNSLGLATLTGVVDEAGVRYESTGYDTAGRAISSSLAGNVETTQVSGYGGQLQVQYPLGIAAKIGITTSSTGLFQQSSFSTYCSTQCNQPYASRAYDANGFPASYTDFNGNVTATTYSPQYLLTKRVDAVGQSVQRTTTTQWNTSLRIPLLQTVSDVNNKVVSSTAWVYNSAGQVLAHCEVDPNVSAAASYTCSNSGAVPVGVRRWTYTYCTAVDSVQCPIVGLMLSATGPRTDVVQSTTYSYYMSGSAVNCGTPGAACYQPGDLHTVTDAKGHITTIASYDGAGRITRITDANGVNTDLTYTQRGWLASRSVGWATTQFTYTAYGAVQTVTDPDGITTTYGYDTAHRLVQVTDAQGNYIQYTLDAAGNQTAEQVYDRAGALHSQVTLYFNSLGQLTSVIDGLFVPVFDASGSNSYDANGNLVQSTDGLHIQRQQGYDALNRLVQTLENYNGSDTATKNTKTTYQHDSLDRLIQVTDPSSLPTTYSYDGLSNAAGQVSPDTGTITRTFDAVGNVLTSTDAKGIVTTHSYDVLDRLISTSYPDSTQNITYTYDEPNSTTGCSVSDPIGHLTRMAEKTVTTVYCYDERGNVIEKRQILNGTTDTTGYAVSGAARLSSVVYPSGTQVTYSRDSDGRIQAVTVTPPHGATGTVVSAVTYQPFGPVSGYTLGNGQVIARNYDANYRLTDLTSAAFNLHVARDAMGDITAIGNSSGASPATETYSYDPLYRLTTVTEANGKVLEGVTYNPTGDRLSKTGSGLATGTYSYKPNTHQLVEVGNAVRSVDANGNTTAISQAGSNYGFGYSDRNRMVVAQLAGSTVASYTYNALGQRVEKTESTSAERYDYDEGSQILAEYGVTNRDYVWLDSIPVANIDTSGASSTVAYVTADQLDTPRAVSDAKGGVEWQNAYQGNPWNEQAPTSTGYAYNIRFAGQYFDTETGLAYNINRDYDTATGRYVQSDPIGLEGGPSTYSYADQSPLNFSDFYGTRAYADGPLIKGASTIYCDGLGAIAIWLIEQNPCWDDCVKEHEGVHRVDALRSNSAVCSNQPAGTQVYLGTKADTYRSEVRAHDQELDCLRRKLAAMTWCDKCAKPIEDRIDREEKLRAGYAYWLQQHPDQ